MLSEAKIDDISEEQFDNDDEDVKDQDADFEDESDPPEYTDLEEYAIDKGWLPDYDGKNPKSAKEFLDFLPNRLKESNDALNRLQADVKSIKERAEESARAQYEADRVAFERGVELLKDQMRATVEEADTEEYSRLEKRLASMEPPKKPPEPEPASNNDPVFDKWFDKAKWKDHPGARSLLQEMLDNPRYSVEKMETDDFIVIAEAKIKGAFPDFFKQPSQKQPGRPKHKSRATVEGGRSSGKNGSQAAKLSTEQKKVGEYLVEISAFKNIEEYAKAYIDKYGKGK